MVLPVYMYGNSVLRQEVEDIDKDYPELQKLISDMFETMYHTEGIGLAAPQIGRSIAVIVIDASPLAEDFPECADSKMVLINPTLEVIEDEAPVSRPEGCLSLPGLNENVKRHEHVVLTWLDENFVEHEQEFKGFIARVIQHEFDHLEGTVFTDRIAPIRKQMIRNKLHNMERGKVKCAYRVVSAK
ncbi:MAG: peptide deformylase [Bacteroides sp.]|nr:peptide deformylase [Bacteroidales bacterium]MBD5302020.1 peptide deformylase [Bacteroides sp.]MBD5205922.1 peptide deformylase [Bacteroidales bacterium]MBD5222669.1 peptide deformylase [Bacteroidales bacterium]MBD5305357.1 peptide deformylase [Bacteroides sp.]